MTLAGMPTVRVMDLELHDLDFEATVAHMSAALVDGRTLHVATPNVDYAVRARRDPAFREAVNAMDLRVPDGVWIRRAARLAGLRLRSSVTGRLLLPALASWAAASGTPVALVGGPPGVARRAAARLEARHPGLRITLATAPPMGFVVGSDTDRRLVADVLASGARLVFVGLGAPRQDRWIAAHREELQGLVVIGIGAGIDIAAGRFRAAPRWMTDLGLEWLFRLAQEPRRLGRRYLLDDPMIFPWALAERARRRREARQTSAER